MKLEIKKRAESIKRRKKVNGYKIENNFIIPEDWVVRSLNEITLISDYGTSELSNENSGIPVLRMGNMNEGKLNIDNLVYLEINMIDLEKQRLNKGDLLVNRTNSHELVGKVSLFDLDGDYVCASYIVRFILNKEIAIPAFVNYYMNLADSQCYIKTLSTKAIQQANINPTVLKKYFKIPLSTNIKEQQKIVEIISTWDKAIELKEQLIEEKKRQKKGLMKKLLTGKVRLPGFDGAWKEVRLDDIAKQSTQKNTENQEIRVFSCTKYNGLVDSLEYFGRKMFSDDISKYKLVKKEEICYATNHIEEGSIGIMDKYDIGLVSPMYTVFRIDPQYNSSYIFRILKSDSYVALYKSLMSASVNRRGSLRWKEFSKLKIKLPPFDEQTEISNLMNLIDRNIELLEQELSALKFQKKGLMQLLLTGIVRIQC